MYSLGRGLYLVKLRRVRVLCVTQSLFFESFSQGTLNGGGVTEIDIAFFQQLVQVNCADMHFTQKFQQNNRPFSFYGQFYTRFLAHHFLLTYGKNRLTSVWATVT